MGAGRRVGIGRLGVLALATTLAALLLVPSFAPAATLTDADELGQFGEEGSGAGQLYFPGSMATDPVTGHLYVADGENNRISEFTPWGEFVKAFGWDVAPGAVNEQQEVRVRAGAGTFKLTFGASTTPDLPFDASAEEVEDALNALASIGGSGGEVAVEEALGKPETATPFAYVVAFKGSLAGKDLAQLSAEDGATPLSEGNPETELEVRTRAQGTPGGTGLESCTAESGCQAGTKGGGAGQIGSILSLQLATDAAGRLYVLEPNNLRVQRFSPDGRLLDVFGGDVVAHGPDDSSNDEKQEVTIAATGGSFKLSFEEAQTAALPYNATAAEVKAALNGLASIGGIGGEVGVSGGPGDATGSKPYAVSFEGNLGGDDVAPLTLDESALAAPANSGYTLECQIRKEVKGGREEVDPSLVSYQWLRNGAPIAGATAKTYTTTAADEGKAVQCQGFAVGGANGAGDTAVSAARIVAPEPGEAAPSLSGGLQLLEPTEATGGSTYWQDLGFRVGLKPECLPVEPNGNNRWKWTGAVSFTYAWYRNGVAIPGATSSTYTVTSADVATPSALQCVQTAFNAEGTAVSEASEVTVTNPAPSPYPPGTGEGSRKPRWAEISAPNHVASVHQGGDAEVCAPASGDVCKAGRASWDPERLGGGNRESPRLAVAGDGSAFVGEGSSIKAYGPGGDFERAIGLPFAQTGIALDVAGGTLYAAPPYREEDIHEIDPASGEEVGRLAIEKPNGSIATDAAGEVFAGAREAYRDREGEEAGRQLRERVIEFDAEGNRVSVFGEVAPGVGGANFNLSGLATNALGDLYATNQLSSHKQGAYVRAFGPGPLSYESPPLRAPDVAVQYAASVGRTEAELRAKINPHFWNDASYHVQYGTAPCAEGGCEETAEALLTKKVYGSPFTSQGVFLEGLQPGTTYHYRFVAKSTGGGPSYGLERTFITYHSAGAVECPANEAFRTGASAALPDCRAYEMVSPPDKEGGDIVVLGEEASILPTSLDQSSGDGSRFAYGSYRAFGDAESAPYTTQYIAAREDGVGWATHAISPPRELRLAALTAGYDTEFKDFSEDLCEAWLETFADPPLAAGAPAGYVDIYRKTDSECGGPAYEALNTATPANILGPPPPGTAPLDPEFIGRTADGQGAIFVSPDKLSEEAPAQPAECAEISNSCVRWLYATGGGAERFVCTLPGGRAQTGPCKGGNAVGGLGRDREANVTGAIASDGSKVFWTAADADPGKIYMRSNPLQAQSEVPLGWAEGTGNLSSGSKAITGLVAAKGKAMVETGSKVATLTEVSVGRFLAGQPLLAVGGIPGGTTVVSCAPQCGEEAQTLTLSNAATASKEVTLTSRGPMPFAAGQRIAGAGIPLGTTIAAAKTGELTLSAAATQTLSAGSLNAWGSCSEAAKACSYPVSEAAEAETGIKGASFRLAAADGSRALFTIGDPTQGGTRLYEFRSGDESSHRIAGKVLGVMGASKDATRVYLASEEALSGANGEGRSPMAGKPNLYLYEGGGFRFIGVLASEDAGGGLSPVARTPEYRNSRVSGDGLHAAFVSRAALSGYDNTDQATGEADAEVYLYDASAAEGEGRLVCASCNPGGARPRGAYVDEGQKSIRAAGRLPVWENKIYASRALAEDGQRLFFDAADALVPADTNGREDVYEWEAPGTGTCTEESPSFSPLNEGCVDLVSSGQSKQGSEFLDASPSGNDVFFATLSSFVPQDFGLVDVYDARVGGGLPTPPEPAPGCEGEACQGAPEAPNDPTPASESFEGAGNVHEEAPAIRKPKHCAKGKVKRHGKCVRRHKRHAKKHRKAKRRAHHKRRAGR